MTPNVNVIFLKHFRWAEDQKVSERIVEIWPSIIKIVNHWMSLPSKSNQSVKVMRLSSEGSFYSCEIEIL